MMLFEEKTKPRARRGQSLVEFTLVLPLLLLIVAGVLEVANILTIYNRLQVAAREGARFGAAGGTTGGIAEVVGQAGMRSLEEDPNVKNVWVIRPTINSSGSNWVGADGPPPTHFGVSEVCAYPTSGCATATSGLDPARVLQELQSHETADAPLDNIQYTIVVINYQASTLLSLPFFPYPGFEEGRVPLQTYNVLRQEVSQEAIERLTGGCTAYPLAFKRDDAFYQGTFTPLADLLTAREGDELEIPYSNYIEGWNFLGWNATTKSQAFYLANNTGGGAVDMLEVPFCGNPDYTCALAHPGNSTHSTYGYTNPEDPGDHDLQVGDLVYRMIEVGSGYGGYQSSIEAVMDDHVNEDRALRVVVYSVYNPSYDAYLVDGFIIIRITGTVDVGTPGNIQFEFIRRETSCGFQEEE